MTSARPLSRDVGNGGAPPLPLPRMHLASDAQFLAI